MLKLLVLSEIWFNWGVSLEQIYSLWGCSSITQGDLLQLFTPSSPLSEKVSKALNPFPLPCLHKH